MLYYYKQKRKPGNYIGEILLLGYRSLPWNQVFDRSGAIRKRYFREAEQYVLPGKLKNKYGICRTSGKDVYRMESGAPGKTIFFIHGGAYWSQPSAYHFALLRDLLKRCGGRAVIPVYPKAPAASYKQAYAFIEDAYTDAVEAYGAENLVLMGDSAGGGFAIAFGILLAKRGIQHKIIALSPWLDLSCSNEKGNQAKDPWLIPDVLRRQGAIYAKGLSPKDPLVSPLYGEPAALQHVLIITGTSDILSCDAIEFEKKNPAAEVWVYPKRVHDFVLFSMMDGREHALAQIARYLR